MFFYKRTNTLFLRVYILFLIVVFIFFSKKLVFAKQLKSASELDYPPFSIINEDGSAGGFSVELLKAVAKTLGLEIEFKTGPWDEIKQNLISGKLDVLPLVSYSEKRDEVLDFTAPYIRMHGTLFVRKDEKEIRSYKDLKNKELLVMKGDTAHEYAVKHNLSKKLILTDTFAKAMTLLSEGKHDAVIIQHITGLQLIKQLNLKNIVSIETFKEKSLKPIAKPLSGFEQKFCLAVPEGEKELLAKLNEGLAIVIANGIYDRLYDKWFGPILPKPDVSPKTLIKFIIAIILPILSIFAVIGLLYLKREVNNKTYDLMVEIDERKSVEKALRKTQLFNETILNSSPNIIYVYDIVNKMNIYSNEGVLRILGYSTEELKKMGDKIIEILMHPDDFVTYINDTFPKYEFLNDNDFLEHEYRMKHKNGKWCWLNSKETVFLRKYGKVEQIFGMITDITKEKLSERETLILKTAIEQVPVGIALADEHTNIYYCNPQGLSIRGGDKKDLVNISKDELKNWQILDLNGEFYEIDTLPLVVAIEKGKIIREEFIIRNNDGFNHICDVIACPIYENNLIIGGMIVFIDITEKRHFEKQLLHSQKMESISTLAGGIAHDFNNMLTVLTGNISFILSIIDTDDEIYDSLNDVISATKLAKNLTQQLLTFAKGGVPIKSICQINELVLKAGKFVTSGSKSKCRFNLAENLYLSEIDSGQINQVISNLIINADQAMPKGGLITIKTENLEIKNDNNFSLKEGNYIKISVEDEGIGINNEYISNIFDPFFTTKEKGHGLGLATAYSVVKNHFGNITVYSEAGKGTVFNIYLPAYLKDGQIIAEGRDTIHEGSGRILIMDDQEPILKMVGRILERMGYETEFTFDGKEAVNLYKDAYANKKPYKLVILDLTIPGGMGGAETLSELIKIDPEVKAIVSSGYSNDPIMSNYKDYGFSGVVPKPYTKSQLSEVLNKIFKS